MCLTLLLTVALHVEQSSLYCVHPCTIKCINKALKAESDSSSSLAIGVLHNHIPEDLHLLISDFLDLADEAQVVVAEFKVP